VLVTTPTIFLLSPASTGGIRAKQFTSPNANFEAARLYRSPEGVPIAMAFAFMSSLYFRGKKLAETIEPDARVVLLGSVASGKYVDILWPIFKHQLRFPAAFAGLGDMSRGGLMLRAVRAGRELEYTTLDAPRHRTSGDGKIPEGW
jgi:hypothetical protein